MYELLRSAEKASLFGDFPWFYMYPLFEVWFPNSTKIHSFTS